MEIKEFQGRTQKKTYVSHCIILPPGKTVVVVLIHTWNFPERTVWFLCESVIIPLNV